MTLSNEQHNSEIQQNLQYWNNKPILRKIYHHFYTIIAAQLTDKNESDIVELGSGIGNLKSVIPQAICTDLFANPWIDQVENAYKLSFKDNSLSNIIMFDVFHHIGYPGDVLQEMHRTLKSGGRLIIFEPGMSLLGFLVYGLFHHEPVKRFSKINWNRPQHIAISDLGYYAAQGNASRIFRNQKYLNLLSENWNLVTVKRFSEISYVLSGGYSKKQMFPDRFFPFLTKIDKALDYFPALFATRILIVLDKK
jgi:SAM-dependent methyltransferase